MLIFVLQVAPREESEEEEEEEEAQEVSVFPILWRHKSTLDSAQILI